MMFSVGEQGDMRVSKHMQSKSISPIIIIVITTTRRRKIGRRKRKRKKN